MPQTGGKAFGSSLPSRRRPIDELEMYAIVVYGAYVRLYRTCKVVKLDVLLTSVSITDRLHPWRPLHLFLEAQQLGLLLHP